ncbi:uncharacterized protein, partial [Macaca nemestrina]|uniref:uncharacterized protein n=1 Tax=Macaca nemestrina TaxID=9545 RepID=UPI0039B9D00E
MQRGPLSPSPTDSPGALGTWYPGVHRGQGMAGLRVPAFNASLRPITPSHAETQPPETTSSGMHREPLSSTSVAHCESQCRETTGPGMPCAPQAERPEAAGVRGAPPRVPVRVQRGPHAAGAAVVFSSSDLPFDAEAQGQGKVPSPQEHNLSWPCLSTELQLTLRRSWSPRKTPTGSSQPRTGPGPRRASHHHFTASSHPLGHKGTNCRRRFRTTNDSPCWESPPRLLLSGKPSFSVGGWSLSAPSIPTFPNRFSQHSPPLSVELAAIATSGQVLGHHLSPSTGDQLPSHAPPPPRIPHAPP